MNLSTFASTMGIIELLMGLPLLLAPKASMKWMDSFMKDEHFMRLCGALMAVLGGLVLLNDARVGTDVAGLIQLLAWLVFFKGLIYTWWPAKITSWKSRFVKNSSMVMVGGLAATVLGVALIYAAEMM